jgi:hypothetical protein
MKTVPRTAAMLLLALVLAAPMGRAETEAVVDAATQAKITAQLTAQGYEVRKIGQEDGQIEVYAVKDGKTYELYLDSSLNIVKSSN